MRGVLQYNEQKVNQGISTCIEASGFGCSPDSLTPKEKYRRFQKLFIKNPRVKTNTVHISLNFDPSESHALETLNQIAHTYMSKIGFGDQPFLVYQHRDAGHPHIHIVTTNIQHDGSRIDMHNLGRNQSERARKQIEIDFSLVRAQQMKLKSNPDMPVQLVRIPYGKAETKRTITNIVHQVTRKYRYTSLAELNAVLKEFNIMADRGSEDSTMYRQRGLQYTMLNEKGQKTGVPIKASALYGKPTLAFLERQFALNKELRKPYRSTVQSKIITTLNQTRNLKEFQHLLNKQSILIVIRINDQNCIYGITFVDHVSRTVFNGSALGKACTTQAILRKFKDTIGVAHTRSTFPATSLIEKGNIQDSNLTTSMKVLTDLITAKAEDYTSPSSALKRKRKKRKKRTIS